MKVIEYLQLLWINLLVKGRNLIEFVKTASRYYSHLSFLKVDLSLLLSYCFISPFKISKDFLIRKGEKEIYAYGETPLTTLEQIAEKCDFSPKDKVIELGCGRGRSCFWLNHFIGCSVIGIDYIPEFIEKANQIKQRFDVSGVQFRLEDMVRSDLSEATVIYLYGTCLEEDSIRKIIANIEKAPPGTKVISVSYPLTDYVSSPSLEVMRVFPAKFTWGIGDVYLHYRV